MTNPQSEQLNEVDEEVSRQIAKLDYEAYLDESNERLRYQTEFAQSALKNLNLVNGGAIIALFTFLGNDGVAFDKSAIWWSFFLFSIALFLSLFAYFGAYFSQSYFMQVTGNQMWNAQRRMHGYEETYKFDREMKLGNFALYLAIGLTIASLLLFVAGAFFALQSIL